MISQTMTLTTEVPFLQQHHQLLKSLQLQASDTLGAYLYSQGPKFPKPYVPRAIFSPVQYSVNIH